MAYTVKNVKSFNGREGVGYECSIYLDGKKIGTATDTANGGMVDFYLNKGEEEKLDAFCLTLPKWGSEYGDKEYDMDKDIYITNMVTKFENDTKIRRMCKKKTVFTHDDVKDGGFMSMNCPFDAKAKEYLEKEFKGKNLIIYNETITA